MSKNGIINGNSHKWNDKDCQILEYICTLRQDITHFMVRCSWVQIGHHKIYGHYGEALPCLGTRLLGLILFFEDLYASLSNIFHTTKLSFYIAFEETKSALTMEHKNSYRHPSTKYFQKP